MKNMKKLIRYNSPVVLSFTFISGIVLLIHYLTGGKSSTLLFSVYKGSMLDPFFYVRLFGHVLGHIDMEHYANNMLLFLLVGPMLEEKYGSLNLLYIILIVAFITGVVHIIFFDTMLLGASGIVFAFILLASVTGENEGVPLTLIIAAIIYIGEQIFQGIAMQDNISQFTHIVGGILGAGIGMALRPKKKSYL